jgi:predicted dehydrogenase
VRYGVIGTRTAGCEHLLALTSLEQLGAARIVAVSETDAVFREWASECLAGRTDVAVHRRHLDLLASEDLDAVVVAVPQSQRPAVLADVLATDLAVLIEPPACTSLLDCWTVAERATERWSRRGSLTWIAAGHRHVPAVERFLGAIASGATGALRTVTIRDHRRPVWSADGDDECRSGRGADLLLRWVATFDLLNATIGGWPERVVASSSGEGEDAGLLVIVEYRHGARGSLDLSGLAEGSRYDQLLVAVGERATAEVTVPGSTVHIGPHDRSGSLELPVPRDGRWPTRRQTGTCRDHLAFIDAVVHERPTESSVRDGTHAVGVGLAAALSIERGGPVELSELGLR